MLRARDRLGAVGLRICRRRHPQKDPKHPANAVVESLFGDVPGTDLLRELLTEANRVRRFDIEARPKCIRRATAQYEVRVHEPIESPLFLQNSSQELVAVTAKSSVHFVVSAHHCTRSSVNAAFEVRQIHFAQGTLVHRHINVKARVLHAVGREMLRRCYDVVVLNTACECNTHFSQQEGVFSVSFLRAPPGGVAQKIDTNATEKVSAVSS